MKKVNFEIKVRCWKDKHTGQFLVYSKKYDIVAYGKTEEKAMKMFNIVVSEIILYTKRKND